MTIPPARVLKRVLDYADREGDCLVSRYSLGSHGYPQVGWTDLDTGRAIVSLCHLVVWIAAFGPVPAGHTVDHKCRNKRCVESGHYRLLTNLDNARRHSGRDWPIGQCANGHDDALHWRAKGPTRAKGYCAACRAEARKS